MAVQKSRKSRARRNMRRSHDGIAKRVLSADSETGELHIRHHITADGYYRGKKMIHFREEQEAADSADD